MRFRLILRPRADRDIDDIGKRIAADNLPKGREFYDAVWRAIEMLAEMPGMGPAYEHENPNLTGLRSWPITGYDKYLLLYIPIERGIDVVRIIHGARDIPEILKHE